MLSSPRASPSPSGWLGSGSPFARSGLAPRWYRRYILAATGQPRGDGANSGGSEGEGLESGYDKKAAYPEQRERIGA